MMDNAAQKAAEREARRAIADERRKQRAESRAQIHIRGKRFDVARYRGRKGFDSGEKMVVLFDQPREAVSISGRDDVLLAIEEINRCLAPDHGAGFWVGPGADED